MAHSTGVYGIYLSVRKSPPTHHQYGTLAVFNPIGQPRSWSDTRIASQRRRPFIQSAKSTPKDTPSSPRQSSHPPSFCVTPNRMESSIQTLPSIQAMDGEIPLRDTHSTRLQSLGVRTILVDRILIYPSAKTDHSPSHPYTWSPY